MKIKIVLISLLLAFNSIMLIAQDTIVDNGVKTGWNFGLLPSIAYDSDLGFQYGGLINVFYYGDGSTYPNYKHSIFLEIARTTKGGAKNQLFYDSGYLFKGKDIRLTADASWLTEQALDFYGFNGAEANYNQNFENTDSEEYISRMFYRHERKLLRLYADFQGNITSKKFRWLLGLGMYDYQIGKVDINRLNKGKNDADKLPDTTSLYEHYVDWGLISQDEAKGGNLKMIKAGFIIDTRDIEANPSKGLWSEMLVQTAPSFLGNKNDFVRLSVIHRQYFTLLKNKLTFVYRLGYQSSLAGNTPFYYQPLLLNSFSSASIVEGVGGSKSLRGVLRNRIVGDGIVYANAEFRYKFWQFNIFNQHIYLAINPFVDAGRVTKRININVKEGDKKHFNKEHDIMHYTLGCGLHAAMNENFVLSINAGKAMSKQDGSFGLYIGTNWLF